MADFTGDKKKTYPVPPCVEAHLQGEVIKGRQKSFYLFQEQPQICLQAWQKMLIQKH